MTTIAYRDGVMASDSRVTVKTEAGGSRMFPCEKLYRKMAGRGKSRREVIIGTAGESSPALVFVDWYGSGKPIPRVLEHGGADFTCLILDRGELFEADAYCRPEKILAPFYAIGSGSKGALAAMVCGKSAADAVRIAAIHDPYTDSEVVTMTIGSDRSPKGRQPHGRAKTQSRRHLRRPGA